MEELRRLNKMWLERTNPLRGLSISRATSMFDSARVWGSPRLQYAYNEIEATDPVLMTCVERRQSALAGLDYRFVASSSEDETLANEQRDALDRFVGGIENFSEVLEHMDLAFFRGFSHVQPIWDGNKVQHVNLLDSWNFLRNDEGQWLWNPACHETTGGLEPIGPDARLVSLVRKRAIDYPAIIIYIRHALGDRDWGRFIERYAIPPVHFEMAAGATDKAKPLYQEAGDAAHNGQNTIRPNGSHIDFAAEARGADPFTPFIEHQDKYIVLLATGGTLTSLAQADTGSLAGGAQMEVWREIVARDGVKIAEALNRSLFRRYLELEFPGRPMAARFELSNEAKPTADEIADLAGKLKTAGYTVDQAELEEAVGLKLVKDETPAPQLPFMNKEVKRLSDSAVKPATTTAEPLNRSTAELLKAFAADMSPAGKAVQELLNALDKGEAASSPLVKEKASALLSRLPSLLPDDPATAAVIAEAMAKEFGVTAEKQSNAITNPCPKCHRQMTKEGTCTHCERLAANQKTVDGLVADLDIKGPDGKSKGWKDRTESLGELEQKTIDDIKAANPKMNVDSSVATVNTEQLQHSLNHHGNAEREAKRGQIAITKDDLKRIPEVLADYDSILPGKGIADGKNQESVVFRKKYPDGTVACVELDVFNDSMKKRTLKFQTMWKEKN